MFDDLPTISDVHFIKVNYLPCKAVTNVRDHDSVLHRSTFVTV